MFKSYIINAKEPNKGAINFSELLDAPAGKHGFLGTTEDGHLAFEDGKRFRIIGTSMVKSGCLPEHDVAECVAERLSSNGINMVRMHYADGICDVGNYDGNELLLIDYSKGNSRELNEVALEHLDYFIYQLKQRGIYVQLDTFVGRNWQPEGDGLDYPDTFPENWAPKNSNIFNRRMIELQKEFDVKFLTHFNPYTGLRYVDDPAIAVVQVMNENSMLWDFGANFNLDTLGPNYKRELQKKWTAWLKKKYGTNEALKEAWTDMFGVCALEVVENVDFSVQLPAQIWQTNKVVGSEHDAAQYQSDSQTRMSDFVEFLIETENAFTKEMYDHLRSIGVKCGINTTNLIRGAANVYTSTRNCTVQEHDAYYNHPYCGFSPPAKVSRIPMVEIDPRANVTGQFTANNLITQLTNAKVEGMPLIIAEWNDVSPTPFDAEAMLEMTAYGSLQDWDGMNNFMYNQESTMKGLEHEDLSFYFINSNDPSKWGEYGISSYVFQKHLIEPAKNTVYLCYTNDDIKANPDAPSMIPHTVLPFFSKVVTKFSDDGKFTVGENEVAISGGYTPTGDFTEASHAIVFSDSPYADLHHKKYGKCEYLAKHTEEKTQSFYGLGKIGEKRLVIEDGKKFSRDGFVYGDVTSEAMRRWGLINSDQGIVNGNWFKSDTDELAMCPEKGVFICETEQFAAFAGHPEKIQKVGNAEFEISNGIMSMNLLSRDGKPLTDSDYILMTCIGETTNEGMKFEGEWLLDFGHAPVLVDQIEGKVTIANAKKTLKVYALAPNGDRKEEIPVAFDGDNAVFEFTNREAAIHYELRS